MIEFTVPGKPTGKGRPRVTRYGTYTPKATVEYERKVQECWRTQSGEVMPDGIPLAATITAYCPIPKSASKRQKAAQEGTCNVKKPDADNIAKAILDALNGLAYHDDSAVSKLTVRKINTNAAPRVEVIIEEETE